METSTIVTQPEEMTLCDLKVVLMPNGEVLCLGKTVGFFDTLQKYLSLPS